MCTFIIHIFNRATLMGFFIIVYRPVVSSHPLYISVIACDDTGQQLLMFLHQEGVSCELTYLRQTVCAALRFAAQTCLLRFLAPPLKPQAHLLRTAEARFAEARWVVHGTPWDIPIWTQPGTCSNPPTLCCVLGFVLLSLWLRYELYIVLWFRQKCVCWLKWKVNSLSEFCQNTQ